MTSIIDPLNLRMANEWDRRVSHDYRYWMSDGVESDDAMWKTGERDIRILFESLDMEHSEDKVALEIGCGVGRLLKSAAHIFGKIIGVDVSPCAIRLAQKLLSNVDNLEFFCGNGQDLTGIEDDSIDFVYSFAALCSMPTVVFSSYLLEISRILKIGGQIAIQVYLGQDQHICQEDTLSLRSYKKDRFSAAMHVIGFKLIKINELILPFEVSDKEKGIIAHVATLRKDGARLPGMDLNSLTQILGIESESGTSWSGSISEHLMAIARARQLISDGRLIEVRAALKLALESYNQPGDSFFETLDMLRVRDALLARELESELGIRRPNISVETEDEIGHYFAANIRILHDRFASIAQQIESLPKISQNSPIIEYAEDGSPIIVFGGVALDQRICPIQVARMWVERALNEDRIKTATSILVAGCASGYHLEELLKKVEIPVILFEPNLEILRLWLSLPNVSKILPRIAGLFTLPMEVLQLKEIPELLIHLQSNLISSESILALHRNLLAIRGVHNTTLSIALVGPIYGGTLPMVNYLNRALAELKQRVHVYNFSNFQGSYAAIREFVTDESRRNSVESRYVEFLSDLVLEGVRDKPVDLLISLAQAPLSPRVLTELRNLGVVTAMWFVEDCERFKTWRSIAPYYDYMFIIQKGHYINLVEQAGAGHCYYLPTACDPSVHKPVALSAEEISHWGANLSFVGAGYHNRHKMLAKLANQDFKIWGTEWSDSRPFDRLVQEQGRRIAPEEYVKIFNATNININLHSSSERDGVDPRGDFVNPRTFELAAANAFQLVDRRSLLCELFEEGLEIACFSSEKEFHDKIKYYEEHPNERTKLAFNARKRALNEHTYVHRMRSLLEYVYLDRYSEFRARYECSKWSRTLQATARYTNLQERFERAFRVGREPVLDSIICDIQIGKGELTDEEAKLLFLHHVKKFITTGIELNEGKTK